jgi:hypothetical protein
MTAKAVEIKTDSVMTLIAETLAVRVASSATVETSFVPVSVTNELFSDLFEKVHVMEPHVLGVSNAFLILWIRPFKEWLRSFGTPEECTGDQAVPERKQNNHDRNGHHNTLGIAIHCSADFHFILRV